MARLPCSQNLLAGIHEYWGHIIVGLIWGAWHIPYFLFFLAPAQIQSFTALPVQAFIPLACLGLVSQAVVYGEIRLRTHSVWPAVLLHTMGNALIDPLVTQFVVPSPGLDWVVSPAPHSVFSIVSFGLLGTYLYRRRRALVLAPSTLVG